MAVPNLGVNGTVLRIYHARCAGRLFRPAILSYARSKGPMVGLDARIRYEHKGEAFTCDKCERPITRTSSRFVYAGPDPERL